MKNTVKKLAIDMGNSTICVAAVVNGEVKKDYINSIYTKDTALVSGDVIETGNVKLALGAGRITLTNVDKTNREYLEHQILWSAYTMFGEGKHYINLATGLPISAYKAKKVEYEEELKKINNIKGKVNGNEIEVHITDLKVLAEGHSSIRSLSKYINKSNTTLIIDIGMKTTDVLLIEWDGKKFVIHKYDTINIALYDIYTVLQNEIAAQGVEVSIEEIDRKFKSDKPIIRTEKGDFDLKKRLVDTKDVCLNIFKDIENKFGKTILHDKVLTGGGAEKLIKALDGKIKNSVNIPDEMRYYSNVVGYLLSIK